jgi:FemAB-related protein (PEP-CTERM system-associated)
VVEVIATTAAHDAEWNAFVDACPTASFYHRAEWRTVTESSFGHRTAYLAARRGGRLVGVFPLVQLKSVLFGNIGCSLPFVNYGGPAAADAEVEEALLAEAARVCERWRVDYLEIRSQRRLADRYPSSEHKVSMTVELDRDPDQVFNAFKSDHRRDIRRAYKNGFTVTFGGAELLDEFYAVLSQSWRDLGTPIFHRAYLSAVTNAFPTATRICLVRDADGVPAAAAFDGIHRDTVEGMWLGMRDDARRQMVGYVLYWELIKDACERGHTRFHLGRSTSQSGSEVFKKKWNAVPTQLYWQYLLRTRSVVPQLNPDNRKYQLAIAAWRKLPLRVTQHIGPLIARSIP